jgi:hypothetical protein
MKRKNRRVFLQYIPYIGNALQEERKNEPGLPKEPDITTRRKLR